MKTWILAVMALLGTTAQAWEMGKELEGYPVAFYTEENINKVHYTIQYPSLTNDLVLAGRQLSNRWITDCVAFVSNSAVPAVQMQKLASALRFEIGNHKRTDVNAIEKNGTVLFSMKESDGAYQTQLIIETRDGKSFSENMKRILGENVMNLRLEYRRNCHGIL